MKKVITTILILFLLFISSSVNLRAAGTPDAEKLRGDMVFIKGGTYEMGAKGYQKSVTVGDFYIGKYEVTNKEYCEYDPDHKGSWSNSDYPVETVSWDGAVAYCKWLSSKTGKNYRLPTEAEWEYACRAGSSADYYWGENYKQETGNCPGIDDYAWYYGNSSKQVHPVGKKKPNAWGLYDMSGNVWEWCSDWYDDGSNRFSLSPLRVSHGGGWDSYALYCQSGCRNGDTPDTSYGNLGFRVVLVP